MNWRKLLASWLVDYGPKILEAVLQAKAEKDAAKQ